MTSSLPRRTILAGSVIALAACTPSTPQDPEKNEIIPTIPEQGDGRTIYVSPTGSDSNSGATMSEAMATLQKAVDRFHGEAGTIVLGVGVIRVEGSCKWPRASISLIGQGSGLTTLKCVNQNGPALDFTNVVYKLNGGKISGFSIEGDGRPGIRNSGIKFAESPSPSFIEINDVMTKMTGGPGLDLGALELSQVRRVVIYEPVYAAKDDIPYISTNGAFNGNSLEFITFIGTSPKGRASAPISGCLRMTPNAKWAPRGNVIRSLVSENICSGSNSTIIHITGGDNLIDGYTSFDGSRVDDAQGSSHVRFSAGDSGSGASSADANAAQSGGNLMTGIIPGGGSGPNMGIDMRQSYNSVVGVKGFNGKNVVIAPGVSHCSVTLAGAVSQSLDIAVEDNSGVGNNLVSDAMAIGGSSGAGVGFLAKGSYYGSGAHTPDVGSLEDGRLYAVPLPLPAAGHFNEAAVEVTSPVAGCSVRVGVYASNPLDCERPAQLLSDLGSVAADTGGVKAIPCDITIPAGLWWLAVSVQGGTLSLRSLGRGALPSVCQDSFIATNAYRAEVRVGSGALPQEFGRCTPVENGPKLMLKVS